MRMAGQKMGSFGLKDDDLVEIDGTRIPKENVDEYVKNNYKKNKQNRAAGVPNMIPDL